jgi:hypothetical protein
VHVRKNQVVARRSNRDNEVSLVMNRTFIVGELSMLNFVALETGPIRDFQTAEMDANGHACERTVSTDNGTPCRHCLRPIERAKSF